MKDIGGLAKASRFFALITKFFRPSIDFNIYVARKENDKIAVLLLFYFNQTVEYFTPVVVHENRPDQPLAGIIFEAMSDAINRGYRWWTGEGRGQHKRECINLRKNGPLLKRGALKKDMEPLKSY